MISSAFAIACWGGIVLAVLFGVGVWVRQKLRDRHADEDECYEDESSDSWGWPVWDEGEDRDA